MPAPLRSANVMIVEDDPDHAELARRTIADQDGANAVTWFAEGAAALEHLRAAVAGGTGESGEPVPLPDLVLLNLRASRRDGIDVLAEIKHDPRLKAIPVVAFSDSGDAADAALAYRHHANSCLAKPASRDDLARMMRDVVRYWLAWNRPAPAPAPR